MEQMKRIKEATQYLKERIDWSGVELAVVLGSGLSDFADSLKDPQRVPFAEVPHFRTSEVVGHGNELLVGGLGEKRIAVLKGRVHFYEGNRMDEVTLPIRVLGSLGIKTVILTNAAGGIRGERGQLMLITDHLDLFCPNPLIGDNLSDFGVRFPDLSEVYTKRLRSGAIRIGKDLGITLTEGVYAYLTGPSYETPFDIQVLGQLGVSAVGMSTVPEAIVAAHSGMEVLGISCITNLAAGISKSPLTHQEVMETTKQVAADFQRLLTVIIQDSVDA